MLGKKTKRKFQLSNKENNKNNSKPKKNNKNKTLKYIVYCFFLTHIKLEFGHINGIFKIFIILIC